MRIFVTGPTGSGKSTLAAGIAAARALPLHALDDIHWVRHPDGDRRRDPRERLALLEPITRRDAWIIEGVQFKWADAALARAHLILVLDLPRWPNRLRILRRFAGRRFARDPGARASLVALREEFRWARDYHEHERDLLFAKVRSWQEKVIVARTSHSAMAALDGALERSENMETRRCRTSAILQR